MLRTLRRSSLAPTLRRLIAVLLGLCVSLAFAEPMIADECEDGVAPVAVEAGIGHKYAMAALKGVGSQSEPDRSTIPDGHTLHLCHCAHAHGGTLTARHAVTDRVRAVAVVVSSLSDRIPPSVVGEPQLRPPRVLAA